MLSCIWERRKFTSVLRLHSGSHAYCVGCYHYSVHQGSYDLQRIGGIAVSAFSFANLPCKDCWAKMKDNNGNEILSELRNAAHK